MRSPIQKQTRLLQGTQERLIHQAKQRLNGRARSLRASARSRSARRTREV